MKSYYEILGVTKLATTDEIKAAYRALARANHPDLHPGDAAANERFQEAAIAHAVLIDDVQRQHYDMFGAPKKAEPLRVVTKKRAYTAVEPIAKGDLSDLYHATSDAGEEVVLKIGRRGTLDYLTKESTVLQALHKSTKSDAYKLLIPRPVHGMIRITDADKVSRPVEVFTWREGFMDLARVGQSFSHGVDGRHIIWLGNRLFAAIGLAHSEGWIHGAVIPQHVLVRPDTHAVMLCGWTYSVPVAPSACLTTISPLAREYYAPEVFKKIPASPGTDIYMAAKVLQELGGAHLEKPIRNFLAMCMLHNPARRPGDAWEVWDRWQELAAKVYGPRKFVQFVVPDLA